ncbi:NAD-dependent epimerase/dehydratase family protein [Chelativorans sp.]|uniref:NAD-dependent epimerase/dehydratase family protein n=1 Tax=Chelativorans sp. TaxID=2203393 RepID=UPI002810BF30|nr:NAD-dependent epimerase/dehydratase family protein [Chelativorans sp.]
MFQNETSRNRGSGLDANTQCKILVTGGGGFIGSHLVDALLGSYPNAIVTVLDAFTYAADYRNLLMAGATGRLGILRGSVEDCDLLDRAVRGVALVCHVAAESHVPRSFADPELFDRVNRLGTRNVLAAALEAGVPRVLHFSTDEVYGSRVTPADEETVLAPTSPYAISKAEAEAEVERFRSAGLDVTILRPSNVVGPRQHREKLVPRFIEHARAGLPFPIEGSGRQRRTFLSVSDLMAAVLLVLERGERNGTYNVAGRETLTVIEAARAIGEALGTDCWFDYVADRPVNDQAHMLDGSRLAALGFRQRGNFRQAVLEAARWMRIPAHSGAWVSSLILGEVAA